MKKRLFAAAAVATSFGLSACQQAPNFGAVVSEVIADTQKICRFVPTAETVINIINAGGPLVGTSEQVANAICNAVNQPQPVAAAAPGGPPAAARPRLSAAAPRTLYGVRIKGHFK
jgi:hypothetical protein